MANVRDYDEKNYIICVGVLRKGKNLNWRQAIHYYDMLPDNTKC